MKAVRCFVFFFLPALLFGQDSIPRAVKPPVSKAGSGITQNFELVKNLAPGWKLSGGGDVNFPWFSENPNPELILPLSFPSNQNQDSFFLYLSGISGKCAIFFDDVLIWICEGPHKEWLFPFMPPLPEKSGFLRLEFSDADRGASTFRSPAHGIGGDILLLKKDSLRHEVVKRISPGKGPALVLTCLPEKEWVKLWQAANAQPVFSGIYLPYRPSLDMLLVLEQAGIPLLDSVSVSGPLVFFPTAYPSEKNFPLPELPGLLPVIKTPDRVALIFLVIVLIIGLLFYRFLDPDLFRNFFIHLLKPDTILKNALTGQQIFAGIFLVVLRVFLLAFSVSIFIHFADFSGHNFWLNVFTRQSVVYFWVTTASPSLTGIFFAAFLGLSLLELIRIFIFRIIGLVFGRFDLSDGYFYLENAASFPLAFLLGLPGVLLFFGARNDSAPVLIIWLILGLVFFFRRLWVLLILLKGKSGVPPSLRILYICTLEILPWVIIF